MFWESFAPENLVEVVYALCILSAQADDITFVMSSEMYETLEQSGRRDHQSFLIHHQLRNTRITAKQ